MGRAAYAFRDLDEELQAFVSDEASQYEPHFSPPDAKGKSAKSLRNLNGLSESTMLKMYVDHHKALRRRKLLGGALFLGVALLGAAPLLMDMQRDESESALELALSAPYRSIRRRGESDPMYDPTQDFDDETQWISQEPDVGDADPHDTGVELLETDANGAVNREPSIIEEAEDSDDIDAPIQEEPPLDSLDDNERQTLTGPKRLRVVSEDKQQDDDVDDEPNGTPST